MDFVERHDRRLGAGDRKPRAVGDRILAFQDDLAVGEFVPVQVG